MTTGGEKQGTTIAQGGFTANNPRFMAFVHGFMAFIHGLNAKDAAGR